MKIVVDSKEFKEVMSVVRKVRSLKNVEMYMGNGKVVVGFGTGVVEVGECDWLENVKVHKVDLKLVSGLFGDGLDIEKYREVVLELEDGKGVVSCGDIKVDFSAVSINSDVSYLGDFLYGWEREELVKLGKELVKAVSDVKDLVIAGIGSFIWGRVAVLKGNFLYLTNGLISVKREGDFGLKENEEVVVALDSVKLSVELLKEVEDVGLLGNKWLVFNSGKFKVFCALFDESLAFKQCEYLFDVDFVPVLSFSEESRREIEVVLSEFKNFDDFVVKVEGDVWVVVDGGERGKVQLKCKDVEVYDSGRYKFLLKVGAVKRILDKVDLVCKVVGKEDDAVMFLDSGKKCWILYSLLFGSEKEIVEGLVEEDNG